MTWALFLGERWCGSQRSGAHQTVLQERNILYTVHKWLGPTNRTLTQKSYFIRENIKSEVVFYEKYDTVTFAKLLLSYFDTNL